MPRLKPGEKHIDVIVSAELHRDARVAAAEAGMSLAEWARRVLATAARGRIART